MFTRLFRVLCIFLSCWSRVIAEKIQMVNNYLTYVILAIAVTAVPGPAVILTIRNSLRHGYKVSIANILGNFTAMVILVTLSAAGLGAIILSSSFLFSVVKVLGCVYLVYLGVKALSAPHVIETGLHNPINGKGGIFSVFKEGFVVGLANPKAIAFFTALFPQFIDPSRAYVPQFLTLILTIEGISFVVLSSYALMSSVVSPYLSKSGLMNAFNRLTGVLFIGFGVALIYEE